MRQYLLNLVLFSALLVFVSCRTDKMEVAISSLPQNVPDETSYQVIITEFIGDRVDYTLDAQKIVRYYDRRLTHAYGVILQNFNERGLLNSTVKADTITVDEALNIIIAIGNVYMSSINGNIRAPRIIWDRNVDEIFAPANVTLTRGDNVLRGSNLRTDTRISFAEMNTVSAVGRVNEKEFDW